MGFSFGHVIGAGSFARRLSLLRRTVKPWGVTPAKRGLTIFWLAQADEVFVSSIALGDLYYLFRPQGLVDFCLLGRQGRELAAGRPVRKKAERVMRKTHNALDSSPMLLKLLGRKGLRENLGEVLSGIKARKRVYLETSKHKLGSAVKEESI